MQVCRLSDRDVPASVSSAGQSRVDSRGVDRRESIVSCRLLRLSTVIAAVAVLVVAFGAVDVTAASAATGLPVWPAASELTLPSGANTSPGGQDAGLDSVTCTSPGNCVAVGSYDITAYHGEPMVATETSGAWGQASQFTLLPSGANPNPADQNAYLYSVTCTSPGSCVAVGSYTDTNDNSQAMVATETSGVWAQASELTLPAGANTSPGGEEANLYSVTCTSPGNCVAVGFYTDANGSYDFQAMVATETGGVWAQASELTLPTGANTSAGGQGADLGSVTCTSPGSCVAVGSYSDTNGSHDYQAMVATETGGVWARASELTLPAGANTSAGGQYADLGSVTCTSPGSCVAVGYYTDTNGKEDDQAMVATETSGVWVASEFTLLPSGASTSAGGQDAGFDSVTCTSPGSCVVVGSYVDTNDNRQAMLATETGGAWAQASELTLPAGATTTAGEQQAYLGSVTCTSPGSCVAVGDYTDTNGSYDYQAMVLSSVPSLAVATSSLPSAVAGSAYSAQLSATGGAERYTWSLSSGSLPAGLSLNASTGVISGTPTASGTSSFTIAVSDPGPPDQQASDALSILVSPSPVPISALPALIGTPPGSPSIGTVKIKSSKVMITVTCAGKAIQHCTGTLALTTLEHLLGHKLTAISAGNKPKKPKKATRKVALGSATYALTGGASTTLTITLNSAGKQLLAKYHKLPAKLTLTPTGEKTATATKTVTITRSKTKAKHS